MPKHNLEYVGDSSFQGYRACFTAPKQNISLNSNNIFNEGVLTEGSTVKYSLTTAKDGKKRFAFSTIDLDTKEIIKNLVV